MFDFLNTKIIAKALAVKIGVLENSLATATETIKALNNRNKELEDRKESVKVAAADMYNAFLETVPYIPVTAYHVYDQSYDREEAHKLIKAIVAARRQERTDLNVKKAWIDVYVEVSKFTKIDLFKTWEEDFKVKYPSSTAYLDMIVANTIWYNLFLAAANRLITKG